MYTRSYNNRPTPQVRSLPPDYGGTALVISQPDPAPKSEAPLPPPPRFAERRHPHTPASEKNDIPQIRRETLTAAPIPPSDPIGAPPFGGMGQPSEETSAFLSSPGEEMSPPPPPPPSPLDKLFDPANLKSDDLLLLGLLLLLAGEGSAGQDSLLLLAALYMAGL